jgi:mercury(II) reductase
MISCCTTGPKSDGQYDLAVIGAGSAGFSAAITAAELGAKVALVGHDTIGGTCVNTGCVPSKTLIRAAESLHQAHAASRFAGIEGEGRLRDWPALVAQKDDLVASLRQTKYADLLPHYEGVTYLGGPARLTTEGVRVNGSLLSSDKVVIATGARPAVPAIPGIEGVRYLTSTTALSLEQLPRSLLVVGGGYVGCELAQMFSRAGVEVTLVFRSRLLPEAEPEIGEALTRHLRDEGLRVRGGLSYSAIRNSGRGIALDVVEGDSPETFEADQVLVATGRRPNSDDLGLEEVGVALLPNGGIKVDDRLRTTATGVYAAGDVTGRDMFVYMAAYGARVAANNALNGDNRRYDATAMPSVVFTDPQVASCGLTEAGAKSQGLDLRASVLPLGYVPRALAARDTRGLIKLVAEAHSGRLLGAHILAPEAADSIQTAVLAIKHGLTVTDLAETIFPYLTTVEGLKLAAQTFEKDVAKLSCCAG